MGVYRQSRAYEASIIDYLTTQLQTSWSNVEVKGTFPNIARLNNPIICVLAGRTQHSRIEIGSSSTRRDAQIFIHIFAENDGQRLDLKDYLISILKDGCTYYDYTIANGQVSSKTENGNLVVTSISDTPIDLLTEKSELDEVDRYRHLIELTVRTGKVET